MNSKAKSKTRTHQSLPASGACTDQKARGLARAVFDSTKWWRTKDGTLLSASEFEDSHLLHTIVKMERDKKPTIGSNLVSTWYPKLLMQVRIRNIGNLLTLYCIKDAKKHNDTRRLVAAIAEGEKNGWTSHAETSGEHPEFRQEQRG